MPCRNNSTASVLTIYATAAFLASSHLLNAQVDVLSYHGSTPVSNGVNANEQQLLTGSITTGTFGKQFSTLVTDVPNITGIPSTSLGSGVDYTSPAGQVYAEPLVKTGVTITTGKFQGLHDVVFVATSMDSLFAIDATTGNILWKDSFIYNLSGNPNPVNPAIAVGVTAVPGGYGTETNSQDVSPWIGIVNTPVIDGVNGYIYLTAKTREVHGGDQTHPHYVYTLHKVRLSNGLDTSVVIADTTLQTSDTTFTFNSGPYVLGTGDGAITVGSQSVIYFNAVRQMIRPALELYNGRIYIAAASHGDNQPYHGWILTYDATSLVCNGAWNSTPNGSEGEGGIWQGGGGVVIDSSGYIYFETGNGSFDGQNTSGVTGLDANNFPINGNYGDCFVKLALDSTSSQGSQGTNKNGWGLKIVDYFSPYNNHALDSVDEDLGSGGPTILPDAAGSAAHPHLLIGGGKQGILYLIDRDNMGKYGASDAVVQKMVSAVNGSISVPSYFNGKLYTTPGYGGSAVSWPLASGVVNTSAVQTSPESIAFPGCSPYLAASGTAKGVMWVVDHGTNQLRAYDATNLGSGAIWTSNLNSAQDSLGGSVKFAVPTPVNGRVYVGTVDHLVVYGAPLALSGAPAAPTSLTALATSSTAVTLSWTDNANNESGFLIERSSDNITFTQISSVGANVTTFGDSGLSSQGTYYYRVRATNAYNTVSYSAYSNVASATTPAVGLQSPVDLYSFDEGSGTATADSAGGNNGTLVGGIVTWITPGRVGSSNLSFAGTGVFNSPAQSSVHVTNDLSPILGSTSSLLFWIKTSQTGNNTGYMAPSVTGVEQAGAANDIGWGCLDSVGHIGVTVGDSGTVSSAKPVNDGTWHHVALTRNSGTGVVNVYIDGVLSSTGTLQTGSKTSKFYLIGAHSDVAGDGATLTGVTTLNAQLDDVRIYNSVVTQATVTSLALPPTGATGLVVTPASGTELDLTWTDNGTTATGYEIWISTNGSAYTRLAQLASTATTYASTGLTPGTTYYYFVRAISASGSTDSSIVSATAPTPPVTPTGATVVGLVPTEVDMTWLDNANNESGYRILRRTGQNAFAQVAQLPPNTTSYADTTVQAGLSYDYHIQAYNVAGVSDFTGFTVAVPTTVTAPPAATNPVATTTSGTALNLSWTDNALNETSYQVWGTVSGGTFTEIVQLPANTTSVSITGLTPGTSYSYFIRAINATGTTDSAVIMVTAPGGTGTGTTSYVSDLAYVAVANGWGPVEKDTSNGENAAGDGHTITIRGTTFAKGLGCHANSEIDVPLNKGYSTFSSSVGIDDEVNGQGTVDFQVIADGTIIYDSGTITGASPLQNTGSLNVTGVTTLKLMVNMVGGGNAYDHADWAGAQVSSATVTPTAPAAATGLVATASSGTSVGLTWVDNALNETAYQVWGSVVGGAFSQVTQLAANTTSYTVSGLTAGTSYSYFVRAINATGSADSSTVSVTTPVPTATAYVSDLAYVAVANGWGPVEKDTSNGEQAAGDGHIITIRGTTFAKGLGCHANSEIDVPLNKGYSTFTSSVGIDDEVNGLGSVDFQVIADGVKIYDSGTLTGTSAIQTTGSLNVAGVTTLKLLVNLVGTTNGSDHADWAGAQVSTTVAATPPAATGLVATATSGTTIGLTWVDNATNETGYQVWGSVNGGAFAEVTPLPANTTTYTATGLTAGSSYAYFVRAINASGSNDSTTVSVTTPVATANAYVSDLAYVAVANGWGPVEKDTSNGEDATGDGHTITIRGTTFAKGLGCHANSEVDVPLNKGYSTFSSSVGVDDETLGQGTVDFQVIADGVKIYDSGTVTGTSALQTTGSLNVSGVTTLKLMINLVGGGNAHDHGDWAGAQVSP